MLRLVLFLFIGPWWVRLILTAATFALSLQVWAEDNAALAMRRALALQPAPAVTPIAAVRRNPALPVQEVHLRAVLALDPSARVTEQDRKGLDERLLYVLQDETAQSADPMVRAIVLLQPQDKQRFLDLVRTHTVGHTAGGPVIELGGTLARLGNAQGIGDLFRKTGLKAAMTYVQISPFLSPRAEALADLPAVDRQQPLLLVALAALFAFAGFAQRGKTPRAHGHGLIFARELWVKALRRKTAAMAGLRPQIAAAQHRWVTLRHRLSTVRLKTPGETAISLGQALSHRLSAFDLHLPTPALASVRGPAKRPLMLTDQMENAAATLRGLTRRPVIAEETLQPDPWHRIERERHHLQ